MPCASPVAAARALLSQALLEHCLIELNTFADGTPVKGNAMEIIRQLRRSSQKFLHCVADNIMAARSKKKNKAMCGVGKPQKARSMQLLYSGKLTKKRPAKLH